MPEEKTKIIVERLECIGCGTCVALCDKFFEMLDGTGKAHLKGSKEQGEKEILEVVNVLCAQEAAESCPVQCIHIQ